MTPNRTRTVALVAALLLVTAVALPASVAAASADDTGLTVDVDQQPDSGEALVTVYENNSTVENATVEVNATAEYNGTGTHETDANGEVLLPEPNETIDATLSVTYNGSNLTKNVTLVPRSDSLDVAVEQEAGQSATVNVTQYGDPVENATVNVSTAENVSYVGNGSYETNANGTVELPAPEENVTVTVAAEFGDLTATTETDLVAAPDELAVSATQEDDGSVAIEVTLGDAPVDEANVTVSGNYTYADEYVAENGTLSLPAPTENTTIDVTADAAGQTANATLDLVVQADDNPHNDFAEGLVTFIHFIQGEDVEGPLGQTISEYVHEHNPAADNAHGPPEHAGPDAADDDTNQGNASDRHGPPEHAGPNAADDDDDRFDENETVNATDDDGDQLDVEDDNEDQKQKGGDDEHGPPEHAGPK